MMDIRLPLVWITAVCCCMSCSDSTEQEAPAPKPAAAAEQTVTETRYDCKTIDVEGGYGYDIYVDGNLFVHQTHIPAVPGVHPFATESDAWRAGSFAVEKMKQGIVPPTISVEELQSIGITLPAQN